MANKKTAPSDDNLSETMERLYREAEEALGANSDSLRRMALVAYEHRHQGEHMKFLSGHWGRNARHLATAVARFPEWFMGVDSQQPLASEADELLSIFYMCQLPLERSRALYKEFRAKSLRYWQVRERVDAWKDRHRAAIARMTLRVRGATVTHGLSLGSERSVRLSWTSEPLLEPETWLGKEVDLVIAEGVRHPKRTATSTKGKAKAA